MAITLFHRERIVKKASASTLTCYSDKVPYGQTLYIERIAVTNDTTDGSVVQIGLDVAGYRHIVAELTLTTHGHWYTVHPQTWLSATERLVFHFTGLTSGDGIEINITGHYAEVK